jgi:A/G-specific adenine glycosylase
LLKHWYAVSRRELPWRNTREPYRILVSEVMLQQTRVAAVLPYYERFLALFPTAEALASAPEREVLAAWAGLGYYSRARNLQRAAAVIAQNGFPNTYEGLRALPGCGDYTAAAVASIAFGLPHAAVDGNVRRVLGRLLPLEAAHRAASRLLDRKDPGGWNQALMELGATVCLPRNPDCPRCPLRTACGGPLAAPPKPRVFERIALTLLVIRKRGRILVGPHGRGFWQLPGPEDVPAAIGPELGRFRHTITRFHYEVTVREAALGSAIGLRWARPEEMSALPVTTMTRKALRLAGVGLQPARHFSAANQRA